MYLSTSPIQYIIFNFCISFSLKTQEIKDQRLPNYLTVLSAIFKGKQEIKEGTGRLDLLNLPLLTVRDKKSKHQVSEKCIFK